VVAAHEGVGAQQNGAAVVADDHIRVGNLAHHVQIQQKVLTGQAAVKAVGRSQIGHNVRVLLQSRNGGFLQKIVHLQLKGSTQNRQRDQQDGRGGGKAAAEGRFHPYSTSNL